MQAKRDYLAATLDVRGIHEKALLEATLFGLPMLAVNMPAGRGAPPGTGPVITPTAVASGPAAQLGLKTHNLTVAPTLTPHTQTLRNLVSGTNVVASWLSGPDGVVSKAGEPALPLATVNVTPTDASVVLRGVGFRGGTYVDSAPLLPFTGAPTTEVRGVHVPFVAPVFYPGQLFTPNYFGALAGTGGTQLLVTPAQHRVASLAAGTSTQRRYTALDLRLFYSGNLDQGGALRSAGNRRHRRRKDRQRRGVHRERRRRSGRGDPSGMGHLHQRRSQDVDVARSRAMRRPASRCLRYDDGLADLEGTPRQRACRPQVSRAGGQRHRPRRPRRQPRRVLRRRRSRTVGHRARTRFAAGQRRDRRHGGRQREAVVGRCAGGEPARADRAGRRRAARVQRPATERFPSSCRSGRFRALT